VPLTSSAPRAAATAGARVSDELPLDEIARALAECAGVSLGEGLDHRLQDGVHAAAAALGVSAAALARRVAARDREALTALVEHSVVGETAFWRHPEQLASFTRAVRHAQSPLRVWCAGCASGEEPYSVAIALLEAGRSGAGDRVLGTDVSTRALAAAAVGTYRARALRRLPPALDRWLEPGEPRRVRAEVRAMVSFARHNLVADPVPDGGGFDAIFCRNVLIYFSPEAAAAALYRLVGALAPGGLLVLGPVEVPLAAPLALEWLEDGGATILRRPRA
jgi:chemotaxis protein methyltransferase CheR